MARRPALGYLMVGVAAVLWAVNGTVVKVLLASGLSSVRVAELRSAGAAAGFALALLATRRSGFALRAREVPFLVFFGICGLSFVQWLYLIAVHRLAVGIALLLQYLAPLAVALWARFVFRQPVRRRVWGALALSLTG